MHRGTADVQYRDLGRTGMSVSLLGLGSVKFGRTLRLKYPAPTTLPTLPELAALLALARDLGINLIDTAPAYGSSEERLGELLSGQRQHWLLCTKVGETFEAGQSRYDFSAAQTRRSVLQSLQRLRTDYLDIVLVHCDVDDAAINRDGGALETLAQLKREGLIRAFGASHSTVPGGRLAVETCDVVMTTLNLAQQAALDVIAHAHARGCGVLIKKALDSGKDADQPRRSLEFVASTVGVSSIVIGTTNVAHLRDDVAALDAPGTRR